MEDQQSRRPRAGELAPLYLGTCAFTARGWEGSFYPRGLASADYLHFYAKEFDSVEVDSTFYRVPSANAIRSWYHRTPPHFRIAAKFPRVITHQKCLVGCRGELKEFLTAMEGLGEKLGPLLLQFPYYNRSDFDGPGPFLLRLSSFLRELPKQFRIAVEIRNKWWIQPRLAGLLRKHGVALALTDHAWMQRPTEVGEKVDPITADFSYIRWLGDRHAMEEITQTWDKVLLDRSDDLREWVGICRPLRQRGVTIYGYVNNHYSGHSPATVRTLLKELDGRESRRSEPPKMATLFEL